MNIESKITINLNESDLKEIVAEYLTKKGYKVTPTNVTISVGSEWVGYGMDEHMEARFKGCTAVVKDV